ncbi:hypothetical protein [Streptomyces sp. RKCA744]|uniref:hypothetical protein n=1 Tax=Streptomyces sp. RKCA744 TaxID=2959340 RepID=UPI00209E2917|nr:hypothetical protein [Streptomyces sp. RKCA744]MCO8306205.1 hypothetical protein [Streptomyces sp. RKCA744]
MASYIPKVHAEGSGALMAQHCSLDYPAGVADLAAHDEDQLSATPPPCRAPPRRMAAASSAATASSCHRILDPVALVELLAHGSPTVPGDLST